jgi:xylan 1,4-beta-xylosidase
MKYALLLLFVTGLNSLLASDLVNPTPSTICNPLNLDYKIQADHEKGWYREAADPVAVFFKGNYYLFASKSGGYWMSPDFRKWTLVTPPNLPLDQWAPAVFEYKNALYFMATGDGKIYRSEHPESRDSWTVAGTVRRDQDPDLFLDDDGRVYLYYGCHEGGPISGVELDPANHFAEIGMPLDFIRKDPENHGWERLGERNNMTRSWIEGAWMTKHGGRYYLQYAAPGTSEKGYGDGCYVADHPLGPFTYQENSPISHKPTGFLPSAGHSATLTDAAGNLWRIVTALVGANHGFERRVALYPQGFDKEGRMFTPTTLGDYPQYLPGTRPHPESGNSPGWMLLSHGKPVTASSALPNHPAGNAVDENIRTCWAAAGKNPGEWLQVDLGTPQELRAVQANFAEEGITGQNRTPGYAQRYLLESSLDGTSWIVLADRRENTTDAPHDYHELIRPVETRYVRITDSGTPGGGNFSLRGLRLFGKGHESAPAPVGSVTVDRKPESRRTALVTWPSVPGAEGYIVRYGTAPDALQNRFEVRGTNSLEITCLNSDPGYWFAVDSFNPGGVTPFSKAPAAGR